MVSGAALLMDVYRSAEPNGVGIVWIWGSGFGAPPPYELWQLKRRAPGQLFLDAGYTVFVINHRGAPLFRYPAAAEDAQRAVRFIRSNAERWSIDPDRLGGWGGSSGANLVAMLATLDGDGRPDDPDPVEHESSRIQAAVARAGSMDFTLADPERSPDVTAGLVSYLGAPPGPGAPQYEKASPIFHVTSDDAPMLLIHGQQDRIVWPAQSDRMYEALQSEGVESRLIRIPDGGHGANDESEATRWLNQHLLDPADAEGLEMLISAYESLREAQRMAREGLISEAVTGYGAARAMDARLTITGWDYGNLCMHGGLWEQPEQVIQACDWSVEMESDNIWYHRNRGLVSALLGDFEGAIADFELFLERSPEVRADTFLGRRKAEMRGWVEALRAGENPFTPELLKELRR
jgi:acetyl esterase/lipase